MSLHRTRSFDSDKVRLIGAAIGLAARRPVGLLILLLAALTISGLVGASAVSAQSGADTPQQVSGPGEPQNFRAIFGDKQVTVGWVPPADDGGSPVTEYRLRYKRSGPVNDGNPYLPNAEGMAVTSPHTINGLANSQEYTVEVWAINAFGGAEAMKQPATLKVTPKRKINGGFPNLISDATIGPFTNRYNCISYAAGDTTRWYDGSHYWPAHARHDRSIGALTRLFSALGYERCDDSSLEPEYLKVALYESKVGWTHASIQTPSGLWQSKLAEFELMEHLDPEAVAGGVYGEPTVFMRRRRDANLAPVFAASDASRSVAENTAAGTAIGDPVTTDDPEGDTLTYSLIGADAGHFAIDADSGQLRTKGALDYEMKDTYQVVVMATDGRLLGSIPVTITVMDVLNEDSYTKQQWGTLSLPEGEETGNGRAGADGSVLIRWQADANANDDTYYRLGRRSDVDGSKFRVIVKKMRDNDGLDADDTAGSLAYRDGDDALEIGPGYLYGVRVFYGDGTKLRWDRVGQGLPEMLVTIPVAENTAAGTAIGSPMTPPGLDFSSELTYKLGGPDAGHFAMDASGQLRVKGALDYEKEGEYEITITATDRWQRSAVVVMTIKVTNLVDTRPGKLAAPTFTEVQRTGFRITWQEASGGGIRGYRVQYKKSSAVERTLCRCHAEVHGDDPGLHLGEQEMAERPRGNVLRRAGAGVERPGIGAMVGCGDGDHRFRAAGEAGRAHLHGGAADPIPHLVAGAVGGVGGHHGLRHPVQGEFRGGQRLCRYHSRSQGYDPELHLGEQEMAAHHRGNVL